MTETQPSDLGGKPEVRTYEGTPKLNAALAAVQRDLPRIGKGKTAEVPTKNGGSYSYSYADLADVVAQIVPLLGANGLAFTSWPTLIGNRFVLRYELLHASGESKTGEYPLPVDANAQALGSAITYARRYTLCAVTGVAPDDDDDAAAADAKRQAERAAEQAEYQKEYNHAVESVMGAWANQYGGWDQEAAAAMFGNWSKGGTLKQASPAQLRTFAGFLLSLPAEDAGSTPVTEPPPADERPEQPAQPNQAREPLPLSGRARGKIFALMADLGISQRQAQLEYVTSVLGRTIKSRSEIMAADADGLIKALEADLEQARQTGLVPDQPEGSGLTPNHPADGDS